MARPARSQSVAANAARAPARAALRAVYHGAGTLGVLLLACLLLLGGAGAVAADLAELEARANEQLATLDALKASLAEQRARVAALERRRDTLEAATGDLEGRRADALAALKQRFERIVQDPSLSLAEQQQAYRESLGAVETNRQDIAAQEREIAEGRARVEELGAQAARASAALAELRASFAAARADRLLGELNIADEVTITSAITCARDETIAACIARGEEAALEQARQRFAEQVLAAVTEHALVTEHRAAVEMTPTLVEREVLKSGFRGQGDYFVELSARLRNDATKAQACKLLGLTDDQCRGKPSTADAAPAEPPVAAEPAPTDEDAALLAEESPEPEEAAEETSAADAEGPFRLTVRSNVYYDEVFIDGVAYGSTKLDVMLPPGEYDLEVRKPGHRSYRERVELDRSRTVKATLAELVE